MNLCFIGVYRIQDGETLYLPVLWVGILAVGASVRLLPDRLQGWAGLSMLVGVSGLAWLNYQAMGSSRSDDWQNRLMAVLSEAPEGSVIVSDDWPVRTGLVAIREIDGLGETPAEAGTWAVSLPDALPSADMPASVEPTRPPGIRPAALRRQHVSITLVVLGVVLVVLQLQRAGWLGHEPDQCGT